MAVVSADDTAAAPDTASVRDTAGDSTDTVIEVDLGDADTCDVGGSWSRVLDRPLTEVFAQVEAESGRNLGISLTVLGQAKAGPVLAALLAGVDQDQIDRFATLEVLAGYKRIEAWAAAAAARTASTLADKATTFAHPSLKEKVDATGEEIALRLAISRTEASDLVTVGHGLTRAFTQTGAALAAGAIDFRKAAKIVTTLAHAPGPVAAEVEAEVLHQADGRTPSQLQRDLNKALIAVDPEDAQDRHARARAGRHVNHTKALPDGMASLYAVLPAEDCVTVDLALDAIATTAKAAGDTRTMSQLRADAMAAMARGTIHTGWTGPPPH
ncbi:DUF222 domain-containing protein, partial [Georgenia subflava]